MYYPFHSFLSPAKLNLGLKIVGRRPDGYHLLKSIFCLVDVYDNIDIQLTTTGKISLIEHQQAWFYQNDLAYKAARLLQHYSNCKLGANIRLKKVIPSGAGMGGGSSNAASALIILNQLWQTQLTRTELTDLGLQLGADVPFFIRGKNAIVTGVGEIIQPLDLPQMYFVIVKPDFNIPTKTIFHHLNLDLSHSAEPELSTEALLNSQHNDLEATAIKLYPHLESIIQELSQYGDAHMTGSGSAIYLTFHSKIYAKNVANILAARYNTFLAASLPQSPVTCY